MDHNPHADGLTGKIDCPFPRCKESFRVATSKCKNGEHYHTDKNLVKCPHCESWLVIDPSMDTYRAWLFAPMALFLVVFVIPLMILDKLIWIQCNRLSQFLQKAFVVSKWWLAIGAFMGGLALFPALNPPKGWLDAVIWPTLLLFQGVPQWLWHKARTNSDEDDETRTLKDQQMIAGCNARRLSWLGFGLPVGALIWWATGDPWMVAFLVTNLGHYLVDSKYLPPDKRKLFDAVRRFAHQGSHS